MRPEESVRRRTKPVPLVKRKTPRQRKYMPERAPVAAASPPAEPAPAAQVAASQKALELKRANETNGAGANWPVLEPADDHLAADLIHGQEAIAAYLGIPKRRVEWLLQQGQIPAVRLGLRWTASKRRLTRFFQGEGSEK
jgi:excisionase family DNA binding protein